MEILRLQVRLYGAFSCQWSDGQTVTISGVKHKALIALLVTAANGAHSRAWIQEMLWSLSGEELGRSSLRRALSDLRKKFDNQFDVLFTLSNTDVRLDQERIELLGDRRDGELLEGIDIPEPGFRTWLNEKRSALLSDIAVPRIISDKNITPKIAILPFLSGNNDPFERHFSDLMAHEVSRTLSRSRLIDVISHLSSRRINSGQLDMKDIQAELKVNYVVYGTVRVVENQFRIDADFINATNGKIQWTREFTGMVADIVNGGHRGVAELSSQIGHGILSASVELAKSVPLPNIDSHALLMSSITFMHQHKLASFARARTHLEELVRRYPDQSTLHAWLGKWYILAIAQGWSTNASVDAVLASDCTNRALDINPACSFSLAIDGMIHSSQKQDVAANRFEESVQIDPNNALAWLMYSRLHMFNGNGTKALKYADRACSLSPIDPHRYFFDIIKASAHSICEDYPAALKYAQRSLDANPRHTSSHRVKTIALELIGQSAEAKQAASELLKLEPKLTIDNYLKNHPAGDRPMSRLWAKALKRAGVPA